MGIEMNDNAKLQSQIDTLKIQTALFECILRRLEKLETAMIFVIIVLIGIFFALVGM